MACMGTFPCPMAPAPIFCRQKATNVSTYFNTLYHVSELIVFMLGGSSIRHYIMTWCKALPITLSSLIFVFLSSFVEMEHRALQASMGLPGPGTVSRGSQTELSFPPRNVTQCSVGVQAIVGHVMGEVPSPAMGAAQWSVEQGHLLVPQVPPMPLQIYPPVPSPLPPMASSFGRASREESQADQQL